MEHPVSDTMRLHFVAGPLTNGELFVKLVFDLRAPYRECLGENQSLQPYELSQQYWLHNNDPDAVTTAKRNTHDEPLYCIPVGQLADLQIPSKDSADLAKKAAIETWVKLEPKSYCILEPV